MTTEICLCLPRAHQLPGASVARVCASPAAPLLRTARFRFHFTSLQRKVPPDPCMLPLDIDRRLESKCVIQELGVLV